MAADDPTADLETALLERARRLADEHLQNARASAQRIRDEAEARARLRQENEERAAEASGDRVRRRRVAAVELALLAELDRLRWNLVQEVMEAVLNRMTRVAQDERAYLPILQACVSSAARSIHREDLVAELSSKDLKHFEHQWPEIARSAGNDKRITLSRDPIECIAGVVVRSADGTMRIDDTFEGRMKRRHEEVQQVAMERLFGSFASVGGRLG
jgi:V/A-type H+-transporting ATPase subunit E